MKKTTQIGHRTKIKLKCSRCGKNFYKDLSAYKSRVKATPKGQGCRVQGTGELAWFCGRKCTNKGAMWDDVLSPFRFSLTTARARAKHSNMDFELTEEFLASLWDKQKGLCSFSGLKMDKPLTHSESRWESKRSTPLIGSLDRKDSAKGYTKDNVHYVCLALNYAKAEWSEKVFRGFLKKLMNCNSDGEVVELVYTTDLKSVG